MTEATTEGPWLVKVAANNVREIVAPSAAKSRRMIARCGGERRRGNSERIVAMHEACEGISIEALRAGVVGEMAQALREVLQLVDGPPHILREALVIQRFGTGGVAAARAALAKLEDKG